MRRSLRAATRAIPCLAMLSMSGVGTARAQDGPIDYVSVQYFSSINVGRTAKPGEKREPDALAVVSAPAQRAEVRLHPHVDDEPIRKASGFRGTYPSPFVVTVDGARALGEGYFALPVRDGPNSFTVRVKVPATQYGDRKFPSQTYSRTLTLNVIEYTLTSLGRHEDGWRTGGGFTYGSDGLVAGAQGEVFYLGNKPIAGALEKITLRRFLPGGTVVTYQLSETGDGVHDGNDMRSIATGGIRVLGADPAGRMYVYVMGSLVVFDQAGRFLRSLGTLYAGDAPWRPQPSKGKAVPAPASRTALLPPYLATRKAGHRSGTYFLSTVWDPDTRSFVSLVANIDSYRYETPTRREVREPGHFLVRIALDGRMTLLATLHEPFKDDVTVQEHVPIFRDALGRISIVTEKALLRWKQSLTTEPLPPVNPPYRIEGFTQDGGVVSTLHYLSADQKVLAMIRPHRLQPVWGPQLGKELYRDIITGKETESLYRFPWSPSTAPPPGSGWTADGRFVDSYADGVVAMFSMSAYAAVTSATGTVTSDPEPFKPDTTPVVEPAVSVFPTASGSPGAVGLIPADENFPAIIDYQRGEEAAGMPVRFSLTTASGAQLRAGTSRGTTVTAVTDDKGRARVRLHYMLGGEPRLTKPQDFTVLVEDAGRTSRVTVRAGLGLVFDRASYLKGSFKLGTYPMPLSIKSSYYPSLDVGLYLFNADRSGAWQGKTPGFQLLIERQNDESGNRGVKAHQGIGHLARVENATLLLTDGTPRYYMTKWELPAVEITTAGTYVYRVNAKLCVLDAAQHCVADNWAEGMVPPALITIVTENPEAWYQSLACSFEAKDIVQYAMFETAKMLPVYGQAVDAFGTATSLTCKLLQGDYESAFYDLGTVLGGKYLDHLKEPAVYAKLTGKQQAALDLAKAAYDKLDEHAKSEQRKALLKKAIESAGLSKGDPKPDAPPGVADVENVRMAPAGAAAAAPAAPPEATPTPTANAAPSAPAAAKPKGNDELRAGLRSLRDRFQAAARQLDALGKPDGASLQSWLTTTTFNWSDNGTVLGTMRFGSGGSAVASWSSLPHGWTMDANGVLLVSGGGRQFVTRLVYDARTRAFAGARDASSQTQDGVRTQLVPTSR